MKLICGIICVGWIGTFAALAQAPVTVTVDTKSRGADVPADFAGVSIFTGTQVHDHKGVPGNLFSGTNAQLITLFKNTGLHHLRLGATGSPTSGSENLTHGDIDSLFAFAKAAGIKVIYSLHFEGGPETAKYVWENYRAYLDYFAFDNEPDGRLDGDSGKAGEGHGDYYKSWKEFAKSVTEAAPGAKFAGPDAAGRTLVKRFVRAEKDSGYLGLVTQHTYVGGNPIKKGIDRPHAIDAMLSQAWVMTNYPQLYETVLEPVAKEGLPFRITELDDYVHGVTNASDAFVSALWAVDVMHWWAAHGAAGVNFQNTEWLTTDTFHLDAAGNYQIHPKAYGIKAFDLGGHGAVESVAVGNEQGLNVTAYAVGDATNLFVTIVNKEHGAGARDASVTIAADGFAAGKAKGIFLSGGDVGATSGVTLGGGTITNDAPWRGEWKVLKLGADGKVAVTVPAASAAVVRVAGK